MLCYAFFICLYVIDEGANSIADIILGSGLGYPSSNPEQSCWHFT